MPTGRLANKIALVTGAGRGIGAAIAETFAEEGARVVVATRTASHGEECVERIRQAGGDALLEITDFSDPEVPERVVARTTEHWGGLDILVHNAASFRPAPIGHFTEDSMEKVFSVNLKACFRFANACLPHFRKQRGGRLLFTSSVTGPRVGIPAMTYYAASKSGMNGFIRNAALELARHGVTVNGVEPGFIRTPTLELMGEEALKKTAHYIPMGHLGEARDVAQAMLFLATDEARYITGQTLVVDGGSTLPESPLFVEDLDQIENL